MSKITPGSGLNGEFNVNDKIRLHYDSSTNEAGEQIKITNKTGTTTVKGDLITPATGTDRAFDLVAVNSINPTGVVYEAGIADGAECWVWRSGIVQVRYQAATTRGHFARVTVSADADDAAGVAISEALPTSPFATDKHFQEAGHLFESIGAAGLALTDIHFN